MKRRLVIDQMRNDAMIHQAECKRQPIATIQSCLLILYGNLREDPHFGPVYLDGLRQAQKDLDHLVNMAAGNPPDATRRSAELRKMATQPEFKKVAKELIAKAERLERQAAGLKNKFLKERGLEAQKQ